jgi:hypothetical protein
VVKAQAGKPAQVRLRWRHPAGWKRLDTIAVRLTVDGAPVGTVTIQPRAERITADGEVTLARRQTRLAHKASGSPLASRCGSAKAWPAAS